MAQRAKFAEKGDERMVIKMVTEEDLVQKLRATNDPTEAEILERMIYHIRSGNTITLNEDEEYQLHLKPNKSQMQ